MAIQVILELQAKEGKAEALKGYFAEILPDTRRYDGCINIDILSNLDNPNDLVAYETWESPAAYQRYFNWRAETGVFENLTEMLDGVPKKRLFEIAVV